MKTKKKTKRLYLSLFIFTIIVLSVLGFINITWGLDPFNFNFEKLLKILSPQSIRVQDTDIKVYFSPNGGCRRAIITEIDSAKKEILVAMYYFTNREIAQALVRAKDRGVKIKVLLDESQTKEKFSKYRYLINRGMNVHIDRKNGLMHNKFAIIDGFILITGSYNWTSSAEHKNRENLLIIKNKDLAQRYIAEFHRLWVRSAP